MPEARIMRPEKPQSSACSGVHDADIDRALAEDAVVVQQLLDVLR